MKTWPKYGEIVVVKVDKVLDYGVFASLLEYEGATGFIHISQVESSWIKNIRNHVREGQMRAALVQKVDTEKLQIDLSLNKVGERQQRLKIEEYKQLQRNRKLVEVMAKSLEKNLDDGWQAVAEPLIAYYGDLPAAFEAIALEGEKAVHDVDDQWVPIVVDVVQKNVKPSEKAVKGTLTISCTLPNGVEIVKDALLSGSRDADEASVHYQYLGAGKYQMKVVSYDYKIAEKALAQVQSRITQKIGSNGQCTFARQEA